MMNLNAIRYVICQEEVAPTTNQEHWQGYVQFKVKQRLAQVKTILNCNWAHLEKKARKSSVDDNITYCSKDETRKPGTAPFVYGKAEGQGSRNDLVDINEEAKKGTSRKQIIDKFPSQYIRYHGGIDKVIAINSKPRTTAPDTVAVYWGETGLGKSRRALWEAKSKLTADQRQEWWEYIYYKGPGKWWDGYEGQPCVIIDDYDNRDPDLNRNYMLKLTDRYPFKVEVKNSTRWFNSPHIWITTNDYCGGRDTFGFGPAFERRIKEKLEFTEEWVPPREWEEYDQEIGSLEQDVNWEEELI